MIIRLLVANIGKHGFGVLKQSVSHNLKIGKGD